jgi:hypothetical protein
VFDFPASPLIGTVITTPDGTSRAWDGVKWVASSGVSIAGGIVFSVLPTNAANDAAAATAGVLVKGVYRTGSALQIRVT